MTTTEQAMREFMVAQGFVEPGAEAQDWYRANWIRVEMWGRRVPVFPIYGFKKTLFLHDLHHLLADYGTDFRGELEIAAWELSSGGCHWHLLYWIDRLVFVTLGLVFAPIRTWRAFRRGVAHKNLFARRPQELLPLDVEELRRGVLYPQEA